MKHLQNDQLHGYITDLLSVERHTLKAINRQKETESVKDDSEAFDLLSRISNTLEKQVNALEQQAKRYGDGGGIKSTLAGFTGTIAGLVDSARKDPISKLMRDNYTAIAMITSGHTMLKSVALAEEDEDLQHVAGNNLKQLAQITTEISRMLPLSVVRETVDNEKEAERIGKIAVEKTQKAWEEGNMKNADDVV